MWSASKCPPSPDLKGQNPTTSQKPTPSPLLTYKGWSTASKVWESEPVCGAICLEVCANVVKKRVRWGESQNKRWGGAFLVRFVHTPHLHDHTRGVCVCQTAWHGVVGKVTQTSLNPHLDRERKHIPRKKERDEMRKKWVAQTYPFYELNNTYTDEYE